MSHGRGAESAAREEPVPRAGDALFELPPPQPEPVLPDMAGGWPEDPVARVLLDTPVPHLDREFDYLVSRDLHEKARPGVRVKVRFGHQEVNAWLVERVAEPSTGARLLPLRAVVSAEPVLVPDVLELARAVARRYAGTVADVLRSAVPPRVARVEKEFAAEDEAPEATGGALSEATDESPEPAGSDADQPGLDISAGAAFDWSRLTGTETFLDRVRDGQGPRAALTLPSAHGAWDMARMLSDAVARTARHGRSAVVVVPDQRDLQRLCQVLDERVGASAYARLTAEDGPTPRYRAFLQLARGRRRIAVGTRSAIWAPVRQLGLLAVWNDGDSLLAEPRAPYQHVREVALLRAEQSGAGLLLASTTRSTEVQRLVETGWVGQLGVDRATLHAATPRVVATADSWERERDPFLLRARLPQAAWRAARAGLDGAHGEPGPVLVQVGRSGFIPALVCQDCGTPARCRACQGPLGYPDRQAAARGEVACRWCGRRDRSRRCPECGSPRLRAGARGVDRTAEELGRAFPQVPVLSSSGDHILSTAPDTPALVIATTGAEPVAAGGYAAALLLDGDSQLQREGLRVPGQVLARWLEAAALVRARHDGGVVVVTASQQDVVGALVRMDPAGYASRQLQERREVHLPPAVRMAEVSGAREAVEGFLDLVVLPASTPQPWIGPVPVDPALAVGPETAVFEDVRYRALLFFPYGAARSIIDALRAARAQASARRATTAVRVRIDPVDLP